MQYVRFEPTPPESVEFIKDYISNKAVFEIGAGDGYFAREIARYAKNVVAVEIDPILARSCLDKGIDTINESFLKVNLEGAEVIYAFLNFMGMYALGKKIEKDNWRGTLISHYYPLNDYGFKMREPQKVVNVELGDIMFPFLIYEL